jgi:hypothetical protein
MAFEKKLAKRNVTDLSADTDLPKRPKMEYFTSVMKNTVHGTLLDTKNNCVWYSLYVMKFVCKLHDYIIIIHCLVIFVGIELSITLWQFLLELLKSKQHENIIQWTNTEGEFKLLDPEQVAHLWGIRKNKKSMNYDKLSRAIRYYYDKDIIKKVNGQKFVYRFVSYPESESIQSTEELFAKAERIVVNKQTNSIISEPSRAKTATHSSSSSQNRELKPKKALRAEKLSSPNPSASCQSAVPMPVAILPNFGTTVNILDAVGQSTLAPIQLVQLSPMSQIQIPQTLFATPNGLCYLSTLGEASNGNSLIPVQMLNTIGTLPSTTMTAIIGDAATINNGNAQPEVEEDNEQQAAVDDLDAMSDDGRLVIPSGESSRVTSPAPEDLSRSTHDAVVTSTITATSTRLSPVESSTSSLPADFSYTEVSSANAQVVTSPSASSAGRHKPLPISLLPISDLPSGVAPSPGFKSASALYPSLTCSLNLPTPLYSILASPATLTTPLPVGAGTLPTPMQLVHFWSNLVNSPALPGSPSTRTGAGMMGGGGSRSVASSSQTLFQFPVPEHAAILSALTADSGAQSPLVVQTSTKKPSSSAHATL